MPTKTLLPTRLLRYRCRPVPQRMWFNPVDSGSGVCRSHVSAGGLSACCGLGALWGEPRPVLEGTCSAHPAPAFTTLCPEETCEAPPAPALPSAVPAGQCPWARLGLEGQLDYETGSEEEDGWPAGGQAEVPSVCAAEGRGHQPGGGRGLTISSCPWFLLVSTR